MSGICERSFILVFKKFGILGALSELLEPHLFGRTGALKFGTIEVHHRLFDYCHLLDWVIIFQLRSPVSSLGAWSQRKLWRLRLCTILSVRTCVRQSVSAAILDISMYARIQLAPSIATILLTPIFFSENAQTRRQARHNLMVTLLWFLGYGNDLAAVAAMPDRAIKIAAS